ncbi:hypothetical protein BDV32DRAFT_105710 [Aspergillus pseudonomiae]|nr:hypothetical protein BDV32DRAFT_105710 [Aspergillus pseudonomiae]
MGKSVTTPVWVLINLFITEDMLFYFILFTSLRTTGGQDLGLVGYGLVFFLHLISSPHRGCASFLSDFIHRLLGRSGDMIQDYILHSCLVYCSFALVVVSLTVTTISAIEASSVARMMPSHVLPRLSEGF